MNGSGKTMLVKLLCRLYDPFKETILLNGTDIREYIYEEYMQQFSVVFQDFKLLALPLGENVGAALDPISEHEIYSGFRRLIGEKTAVFISHRLSSCRFCDDILVFHEGMLVQRGTHEELVNVKMENMPSCGRRKPGIMRMARCLGKQDNQSLLISAASWGRCCRPEPCNWGRCTIY